MKILAIGAHPDDIEPQIGGTLAKLLKSGNEVLSASVVETKTGALSSDVRFQESVDAAKVLGYSAISLGMNNHEIAYNRQLVMEIDSLISRESPNLVFSISGDDTHQEHRFVALAVESALRKNDCSLVTLNQALPGGVSSHSYTYFSDISDFFDLKIKAIECYQSQVNKYGKEWLEMVSSRDRFWGLNFGVNYMEVGDVSKIIT